MKKATFSVVSHRGKFAIRKREIVNGKSCDKWLSRSDTREEAEAILTHLQNEPKVIEAYGTSKASELAASASIAIYAEAALSWKAKHSRIIDNRLSLYRTWIKDHPIALQDLRTLKLSDIQHQWLLPLEKAKSSKTGKLLSHQTVKNIRNVLAHIIRYVSLQPGCQGVDYLGLTRGLAYLKEAASKPRTAIDPKVANQLISDLRIPEFRRNLYRFALYTGLRSGEIISLHCKDIFEKNGATWIRVRFGGRSAGEFQKTKSKNSTRELPLLPQAKAAVASQLEYLARTNPHSNVLFPNKEGCPYSGIPSFAAYLKKDLKKLEINEDIVFHQFRHTFATFIQTGVFGKLETREAQHYLGHSDQSVTVRYSHVAEAAISSAFEKLTGNAA